MKSPYLDVLDKESFDAIMKDFENSIDQCIKSITYYNRIIKFDNSEKRRNQAKKRLEFEKNRQTILQERLDNFRINNAEFFI